MKARTMLRQTRRGVLHPADSDTLTTYLDEIGRFDVLSREAEAALGPRIRAGDPSALESLVCANLRFVVVIAKQYRHQGLSLADLIAEGNLGLIRAAERFDERRGVKFISYAVWWIRQAILQTITDSGHIVRVPVGQVAIVRRIGQETNQLSHELGREPTQRELAQAVGMTDEEMSVASPVARASVSLDAPVGGDSEGDLLDVLADEHGLDFDDATDDVDLSSSLHDAMGVLRGRECEVLTHYFGLDGDEPETLEQIGARFNVTRERVRQIKDKALSRIRRSKHARVLATLR
jgi:RNA polymerase primary sigma factor